MMDFIAALAPQTIGLGAIIAMLICIMIGMPVGLSMLLSGFIGFWMMRDFWPAVSALETSLFETGFNFSFSLIPLFLLMGNILTLSGISSDLFEGAQRFVHKLPGGLAIASLTGAASFASVCGSSIATASAMSRVAYGPMNRLGYDHRLIAGSLAAGGTLGIMIPPSIALLLYALIADQSVSEMFLAGILPGLLGFLLYVGTALIMARFWPAQSISPLQNPLSYWHAIQKFMPMLLLFILVMGGLYANLFNPIEAGAAGAIGALAFALWRGLSFSQFQQALNLTLIGTISIFFILFGAELFSLMLSVSQISFAMAQFVQSSGLQPWQILGLILVFYIILGMVMESLSMILVTVPIFLPLILETGYHPVWFGILAVTVVELGLITPPVGMNLFVVKAASPQLSHHAIMTGILPFAIADIVRLTLLILIPSLALLLPSLVSPHFS